MKPITIVQATMLPLDRANVDTDQIIPSDWLKRVERTGFEKALFSEWRDDPEFVLNDQRFFGAKILVAKENFGIGSSREHAVWAIQQYGFDAVVSPLFGDIFRNNATKNGLVPVELPTDAVETLLNATQETPSLEATVDVERLTFEVPSIDLQLGFDLDPSSQERFLKGLDDIDLSLQHDSLISDHERSRPEWMPSVSLP